VSSTILCTSARRRWKFAPPLWGRSTASAREGAALAPAGAHPISPASARRGIGVKPSDSRAKSYVAQYGSRCWEVDILPAATIEQAIDFEIEPWLNRELWDRRAEEIQGARSLL
jgi:hypothetical protein